MQIKDPQQVIPFTRHLKESSPGDRLPAPQTVEAVLIDFHGVLYDESAWRRWFAQLLQHVGVRANCDAMFATFHADYLREENCDKAYWHAMRRFLPAIGLSRSLMDEVIAAGKAKRRAFCADTRPLPGVAATLARLSTSLFPLAVVCSDTSGERTVSDRLRQLGLLDWFRAVSCVPNSAPRSVADEALQSTAEALGARVARCAYVSACPLTLLNARAQEMATVAFNAPRQSVADFHIDRFQQLTEVLACERTRLLAG